MNHEAYGTAQRALAELKTAVCSLLTAYADGLTNAEIGRALGIYGGHNGQHEGHISRTLLAMMEAEGVVEQEMKTKWWRLKSP